MIFLSSLAVIAAVDGRTAVALGLAATSLALACRTLFECAIAQGALLGALPKVEALSLSEGRSNHSTGLPYASPAEVDQIGE
jgi:hypothetical protein